MAEAFRDLQAQFDQRQVDEKLFHGQRTEVLFAYVAAALGGCRLIKSEDAGEVYCIDGDIRVPDYRLVTTNGEQLLVEVKNCHARDPQKPYEIRLSDLHGLEKYANVLGCELFIAIYWSRWKQWTLIKPNDLKTLGQSSGITMLQAMPRDRMSMLDDRLIGTVPPLTLRLIGSPEDDQSAGEADNYLFTIRAAELYCGNRLIKDRVEQRIAWFLMMNGRWDVTEAPAEMDGSRLAAVTFVVAPQERANPDEAFEFIGRLSDMVSRQFDAETVSDGEIVNIAPGAEPEAFGVAIPHGYQGSELRLWRMEQRVVR